MTQSQLAGDRYTKAYISALETGITRPSMVALNYVADRLGLPASHFLGDPHPTWSRLEVDMRLAAGDWSWRGRWLPRPGRDRHRRRRPGGSPPRPGRSRGPPGSRPGSDRRGVRVGAPVRQPGPAGRRGAGPLLAGLRHLPDRQRGRCPQPAPGAPGPGPRWPEGGARVRDARADGVGRGGVTRG